MPNSIKTATRAWIKPGTLELHALYGFKEQQQRLKKGDLLTHGGH